MANGAKPRVGHVQLAVRRCFIAADGRPLTIRDFLARAFPRTTNHRHWMRKSVHRAIPRFGVPLGRNLRRQGRPMIWVPNAELRRLNWMLSGVRKNPSKFPLAASSKINGF